MKFLLTVSLLWTVSTGFARTSTYHLNQDKVDLAFTLSEDIGSSIMSSSFFTNAEGAKEVNNTTAAIVAFATVIAPYIVYTGWWIVTAFTGGLGIIFLPIAVVFAGAAGLPWHRYYLGTNGETAKIMALYCVTLNWFGWLPIADGVFLLLDKEDSFKNNPDYLMWIDKI